jgi:16S rRNA pseudouridine516 synthase
MNDTKRPQRIDAILSRYGYCSRSEARGWVHGKRVVARGTPVKSTADKAMVSEVLIDGQPVEHPNGILALLHKPAGYVCSHDAKEGPGVYDLLPPRWLKRNPAVTTVGRLDKDTTGVLLVTDQGELVQRWTSPKHKVPKLYIVTVDGELTPGLGEIFASGQLLLEGEEKSCLPAVLKPTGPRTAELEIVEGRYHQVKRMFASQGLTVTQLHRSRFGEFELGDLQPGNWRILPVDAYS